MISAANLHGKVKSKTKSDAVRWLKRRGARKLSKLTTKELQEKEVSLSSFLCELQVNMLDSMILNPNVS